MKRKIKIEHCSVYDCPECNKQAYLQGYNDGWDYCIKNYKFKLLKTTIPFKGKIN